MTPIALTIAGSDSGGCAGIQADLKTFSALGVFGASALTAVTAQNTLGVQAVEVLSPAIVTAQIEAVVADLDVCAIKIGMAAKEEVIDAIAEALRDHSHLPLVLDPVMVATTGDRLLQPDAVAALRRRLLPLASLVTPNLAEAAVLSNRELATDEVEMEHQAKIILRAGARAVLVKGGHLDGPDSVDLFYDGRGTRCFRRPRVATANDHGTGCTLAAGIVSGLAKGEPMDEAIESAKTYLTRALQRADEMRVGAGRGPVHHFYAWWPVG